VKQGNGIRPLILGVVAVMALVAAQGAVAGGDGGTNCSHPDPTFDASDSGTSVRLAAAYRHLAGPDFDQIGYRFKGVDQGGNPVSGAGTCGNDLPWEHLTILLGNKADKARLDNRKPRFNPDFGPVPEFVRVTINGGAGSDVLRGHGGKNQLNGKGGGDTLRGFDAKDDLNGGKGGDLIRAADNREDQVACGRGDDKAVVDQNDNLSGCEDVVFG
jgi:hypothetical protein